MASFRQFVAVEACSEDRSLLPVSPSLLGYTAVLVKCDKIKVQHLIQTCSCLDYG